MHGCPIPSLAADVYLSFFLPKGNCMPSSTLGAAIAGLVLHANAAFASPSIFSFSGDGALGMTRLADAA